MADNSATDKKQNWFMRHKIWTAVIAVILIAAIAGSGDKSKTTSSANKNAATPAKQQSPAPVAKTEEPKVPAEYKSALVQATSYSHTLYMSKQGVYDQLVSPYGGQFKPEAAQYAIDNVKADWNANALQKAKEYQKTESLSPAAIHDQLVSAAGEKFTEAEADYAIQHLND